MVLNYEKIYQNQGEGHVQKKFDSTVKYKKERRSKQFCSGKKLITITAKSYYDIIIIRLSQTNVTNLHLYHVQI